MAKLPVVAIVGKPNVGKSTLLNRLIGRREAIVHPQPGVTRDRLYFPCEWRGKKFLLVDTGGIYFSDSIVVRKVNQQAEVAISEADLVLFVVGLKDSISSLDLEIAAQIRKSGKKALLVLNKVDDVANFQPEPDFYRLRFGEPLPVSALHGLNIGELLDVITNEIDFPKQEENEETNHFNLAIIGRPNVGKSSILNAILGYERALVSDVPGTTRDKVDTVIKFQSYTITLVDTAGLKRKKRNLSELEFYSMCRTLRAIGQADVALLVLSSDVGVTTQDQKIAQTVLERGCALALIFNKWDLVQDEEKEKELLSQLAYRFRFLPKLPFLKVSALEKKNIEEILPLSLRVFQQYSARIPTSKLNDFFQSLKERIPPTGKENLKFFYLTQVDTAPPHFVFFVNRPDLVNDSVKRFLEKRLAEEFQFEATPLILTFKRRR